MNKPLTRRDFVYMYSPDPLLTKSQKVKRFLTNRKPLFWVCVVSLVYVALTATMQALDARGGVL